MNGDKEEGERQIIEDEKRRVRAEIEKEKQIMEDERRKIRGG